MTNLASTQSILVVEYQVFGEQIIPAIEIFLIAAADVFHVLHTFETIQ